MNIHSSSPFREEAQYRVIDRLHGNVSIATPVAWQLIGYSLLAALVTSIGFLALASYARVEIVAGAIVLDRGVIQVVPTRAGVVQSVAVVEGQRVRAGQTLAIVRVGENLIAGAAASDRIFAALKAKDAQLADQGRLFFEGSLADQQRLKAQIAGDRAAIAALDAQISYQKELIAMAETDLHNVAPVAARGYISRRDLDARQVAMLTRRQQLEQLQQALSDKRTGITQAERAIKQSAIAARAQAASAQSDRQTVTQEQAQNDLSRGYALTSPVSGIATGVTARPGQAVTPNQEMLMVVPVDARPRIEIYVPTMQAGFLSPRQEVRIAVDAYPYQKFGTVEARITSISRAAVTRQSQNGAVAAYLVTATIEKPWVIAFGKRQPLLPGMTVSARIVTDRRSLIEWLFEPLFAVGKR